MSNTTTTDKITERVARLLALAEHPNTPAPEAETALLQAHKLMAKHAIDEAIARQSQTVDERRALIREDIEIGGGYTFRSYLATILEWNCMANRVSMARLSGGKAALFGADEDVRWVVTLHNMIHLQLLSKLDPKWDNGKSYDENVYAMKVAGFKWKDINNAAMNNGHDSRESTSPNRWTGEQEPNGFYHKLKAAYVRHAKLIGDDTRVKTQSHQAYRLNFVTAFRSAMVTRFDRMMREAESERDTIPGAALALRDLKDEADRMMWDAFPNLSPEEIKKMQERVREQREREAKEREDMLAAMTPKQREAFLEKEEREYRKAVKADERWRERNSVAIDGDAQKRGRGAADAVILSRNAGSAGAGTNAKAIG